MIMANARPRVRARAWLPGGSLLASMLMNTMLSIPRTTSRTVRVISAVQFSGEEIQSILCTIASCGSAFKFAVKRPSDHIIGAALTTLVSPSIRKR